MPMRSTSGQYMDDQFQALLDNASSRKDSTINQAEIHQIKTLEADYKKECDDMPSDFPLILRVKVWVHTTIEVETLNNVKVVIQRCRIHSAWRTSFLPVCVNPLHN